MGERESRVEDTMTDGMKERRERLIKEGKGINEKRTDIEEGCEERKILKILKQIKCK